MRWKCWQASRFCAQASHWALSRDWGRPPPRRRPPLLRAPPGSRWGPPAFTCTACFLLQILMLRSKFKWERCFQLLPILAHGVLLNFFRYRFAPFQYLAPQGVSPADALLLVRNGADQSGLYHYQKLQLHQLSRRGVLRAGSGRVRMRYGTCKIFLDFAYVIFALLICWRAGLGLGVVRGGHGDLCLAGRCAHQPDDPGSPGLL